jgi:hypothetical protein
LTPGSGRLADPGFIGVAPGKGEINALGDTSTLADPSVVEALIAGRQ